MRERSFDETSDETISLASTVIIRDLDFSDDESIANDFFAKKNQQKIILFYLYMPCVINYRKL